MLFFCDAISFLLFLFNFIITFMISSNKSMCMYCKNKSQVQVKSINTLVHNDLVESMRSLIQMRNETGDSGFVWLKNDAACSGASEREPDN